MHLSRDEHGQFAPGGPGGPGRPTKTKEKMYLAVTRRACTLADWREIVTTAVRLAKAGDAPARRWLSDVLLPKTSVAELHGRTGVLDRIVIHFDGEPSDESPAGPPGGNGRIGQTP